MCNGKRKAIGDKENNPAISSGVFLDPLKKFTKFRKT